MDETRTRNALAAALEERFGEALEIPEDLGGLEGLLRIAAHRVHRRFADRPVEPALLRLLCACALSAPSKSDLQQADIVVVDRPEQRRIAALITEMPWIADAPVFLVFCGNGRRLPAIASLRGKPFPNDHLDLFFNASVDAALVLAGLIHAAEAAGLGCCPISVIRDHAAEVSAMLHLPERIVPVAGLCLGWPREEGRITPRLDLRTRLHHGRFEEGDLAAQLDASDRRREARLPYRAQRDPEKWGKAAPYGWSEDKARQYATPQRAGFGAFVRSQGFKLD